MDLAACMSVPGMTSMNVSHLISAKFENSMEEREERVVGINLYKVVTFLTSLRVRR